MEAGDTLLVFYSEIFDKVIVLLYLYTNQLNMTEWLKCPTSIGCGFKASWGHALFLQKWLYKYTSFCGIL